MRRSVPPGRADARPTTDTASRSAVAAPGSAASAERLASSSLEAGALQLRASAGNSAALQYVKDRPGDLGATDDLHALASSGLEGGAGPLPHRDALQAAFGDFDLGGVRAHVGGAAADASAAMGANAYATGNDVAFAASPDLHTAAHEAAHVVQQRSGQVQLQGGVGRAGDPYERHADAVADAVVAGESAEGLLAGFSGGGGVASSPGGSPLQRDTTSVSLPEALGPAQQGDVATQGAGDDHAFSPDDVNQGSIGDCYFLASLAAVAHTHPQLLEQAIRPNGDGSYTVRLFRSTTETFLFWSSKTFTPVQVVIWPTFPMSADAHDAANPNADANPAHAHGGDVDASGNPELWVRLFEKAYALLMGSYQSIGNGGFGADALEVLTGQSYEEQVNDGDTHDRIVELVGEGTPVEVGTKTAAFFAGLGADDATFARNNSIVGGHAYAVIAADDSGITVRNPWGAGARVAEPRLTWAQYDLYFNQFSNRT